jgi:hypothetical protein
MDAGRPRFEADRQEREELARRFFDAFREGGAIVRDRDGNVLNALGLDILDGQIQPIRTVIDPDKLGHVGPVGDVWAVYREAILGSRARCEPGQEGRGECVALALPVFPDIGRASLLVDDVEAPEGAGEQFGGGRGRYGAFEERGTAVPLAVDLDAIGDDPDRDDAARPDRRVDPPEQAADRREAGKMLDGGERED